MADHLPRSPRSRATIRTVADDLDTALSNCASGQELIDIGYADDVHIAGELDDSRSVPPLHGNAFTPART